MDTHFVKLNDGWNAEPNAPAPVVSRSGDEVSLEFDLNDSGTRILQKGIEDALYSEVAGAIVSAQRMMKAGISASVDSAKSHQLGESSMKSMAISSWNPRLTIGS